MLAVPRSVNLLSKPDLFSRLRSVSGLELPVKCCCFRNHRSGISSCLSSVFLAVRGPREGRFRVSGLSGGASPDQRRRRVVFLGTPEVAASTLKGIIEASSLPLAEFEVVAVVSQPGRPQGRGNKRQPQPTPVQVAAREASLSSDCILCPERAREADFLEKLRHLRPDLCITAAYGNILPQAFLDIPRFGTLNIHPSLLPAYRGAAPVQRALLDGVSHTGVSVAFTVRAMDAGPIIASQRVAVNPDIQAPELLHNLFARGTKLLLEHLPLVWDGRAASQAQLQDDACATHAAKIAKADGLLDFREPAAVLHNKVRALAGWPGTVHEFLLQRQDGAEAPLVLKILATRLAESHAGMQSDARRVHIHEHRMFVTCGCGNLLEILQVQPAGKSAMTAKAFTNGLSGSRLTWQALAVG